MEVLRGLLSERGTIDFDDAFGKEDRFTQAVTLFAMLEMHRLGQVTWTQKEALGPIEVRSS
jgi:segregation and condensation protein A